MNRLRLALILTSHPVFDVVVDDEIEGRLKTLNQWTAEDGKLKKRFEFKDFAESLDFVNRVGAIAEAADHHPDITFGWGYAELTTTTHDRGGITAVDFALAAKIDRIQQDRRPRRGNCKTVHL